MLLFPNAKVNFGLNVLRKRADGYHDIATVMFPVKGLCDALEFVPASRRDGFHLSGTAVPGPAEDNICLKAVALLRRNFDIPPLGIYLHKAVPTGAGLGGGSANGAFMLKGLNTEFKLGLSDGELESAAAELGSDCAFFVKNVPALSEGRGEVLTPISLDLNGMHIALVHPGIHMATGPAYAKIVPSEASESPAKTVMARPVSEWKDLLNNDFEAFAYETHPEIKRIRDAFYTAGAQYAAMTGSGSAVFGIFDGAPPADLETSMAPHFYHSSAL